MNLELNDKHVLITGGTQGIGYACAERFAEEGCTLTLVGQRQESVSKAVESLNGRYGNLAQGLCADMAVWNGDDELHAALQVTDILVNNAGAIPGGGLENVTDREWRDAWNVKVFGYVNTTRVALPSMMQRGIGTIVNIIGIAGADPRYDYICGSMANAGLISFTKAVGAHAVSGGVRVLGINPGPTQTDRLVKLYQSRAAQRFGDASRWQELLSHLPFGRAASPAEIADLVVFAASPRAGYLSGVVIDADGGGMYTG